MLQQTQQSLMTARIGLNIRRGLHLVGVVLPVLLFLYFSSHPFAQTKSQLPAPTTHVNDLAGALDDQTKARLENLLGNLKQRNKIDFYVAVVENTGGQDMFVFSRQLAHDWDLGARLSTRKSLLLVVSVSDKIAFTQFSRSVQSDLPDGILGDMTQRMRPAIDSGDFNTAITTGVDHFVGTLARRNGLSLADFETPPSTAAENKTAESTPVAETTPTNTPTPQVVSDLLPGDGPPVTTRSRSVKNSPENKPDTPVPVKSSLRKTNSSDDDAADAEEVELTLTLPFDERITKLKEFLATHPRSKARAHAADLLISAYAALGDQKLRGGDVAGGTDELFFAIDQAPTDISEKLFTGVIAQIPLNLYVSGERTAAFKAAEKIEAKFGSEAKHLLAIAAFYLRIESGEEAARVAALAVKLAPDMADAHYALAAGLHISLRLEEAIAEYKRTLELDPNTKNTRRSLADLYRATGKAEEALPLYREQLKIDPADKAARAGMVLSLLELGKRDEANSELEAALKDDPSNLPLLTGAAYWFAAHDDGEKSLDLARRAVEVEPRYTWAQIAAARALLARRQPLEAERSLRFARQYGKFPTLDYELASVLSSAGLYDEAAEVLQQSFALKDGMIETRLGGRKLSREANFDDLLAPERRASIFQFTAADTPANAKTLKALLAFQAQLNEEKLDERALVAAAKSFAAGDDEMRTFRQLYAANRLARKAVAFDTVYELAEAARSSLDTAMLVPAVTVAVQADEYHDMRARVIASGGTPYVSEAPRNVIANLLKGKVDDLSGWALFNREKPVQAVEYLRRAANTLPEGTPAWRGALWHLGAALEQTDSKEEALNYYIKAYVSEPDPIRKPLIEQLYRKVYGSLDGLDQRLNGSVATTAAPSPSPDASGVNASSPSSSPSQEPVAAAATPTREAVATASPEAAPKPSPEAVTTRSPEAAATPSPDAVATPSPEAVAKRSPEASATPSPEASSTPTSEKSSAAASEKSSGESQQPADSKSSAAPTLTEEQALAQATARKRATINITGRVTDSDHKGIENVVIVLISPRGTVLVATTDAEGNYSFKIAPSQRNYRLVPSKEGLRFDPVDKSVVAFTDDLKSVDFVATPSP